MGGGFDLMSEGQLVGWSCAWNEWYAWRRHSSIAIAEGEDGDEDGRRLAVEDALDEADVAFDLAVRA
jgi:hypothetical protein